MIIEKKIWIEYFQKLLDGVKTFEIRLAGFDCKEGGILLLKEWDEKKKTNKGRKIRKKVTYVLKTKNLKFFTKEKVDKFGYQIIVFK